MVVLVATGCAQAESLGVVSSDAGGTHDTKFGTDTSSSDDTFTPPDDTGSTIDTGTTADASCTVPTGKKCGTFPQCGCPGKNCDVTKADGTTGCVTAGTVGLHEKCTAIGQCQAGMSCTYGVCNPFCATDSDCTDAKCKTVQNIPAGSTTPVDIPDFDVCFANCDPMNPSAACGSKGGCLFVDGTDTTCSAAGTAIGAGTCGGSLGGFNCAPGYVCVTTSGSTTSDCKKWCRIGFDATDCSSGVCGALTSAPTRGGTEYGVCN
jgi:hypothetical protein